MANNVIYDDRLSYRALGLLTYLLSKPDGWETDSEKLSNGRKEGRDAIRTAMKELREAGYMRQSKVQDKTTGRWSTAAEITDQPDDGFPVPGATSANTLSSQVGPTTGKPTVGYPDVGKPGAIASTQTKDGHQGLETGGTLPPDPLRPDDPPGRRTDHDQLLTLVVDLNGTKEVTTRPHAGAELTDRPLMSLVPGQPTVHEVDAQQLELLNPAREAQWAAMHLTIAQLTTAPTGATA